MEKNLYLNYGYKNEKIFLEKEPKEYLKNFLKKHNIWNIIKYLSEILEYNNILVFDEMEEITNFKFIREKNFEKNKEIKILKIFSINEKTKEKLLKNQVSIIEDNLSLSEKNEFLDISLKKEITGELILKFSIYEINDLEFLVNNFYFYNYNLIKEIKINIEKIEEIFFFNTDKIKNNDFNDIIDLLVIKILSNSNIEPFNNIQENIDKLKEMNLNNNQILECIQIKNKTIKEIKKINFNEIPIISFNEKKYNIKLKNKEEILKLMFNPFENIDFLFAMFYSRFFNWYDLRFASEFFELKNIIERELKGNSFEELIRFGVLDCFKIENLKYFVLLLEEEKKIKKSSKYEDKNIKIPEKYEKIVEFLNFLNIKNSNFNFEILNTQKKIAEIRAYFNNYEYLEYEIDEYINCKKIPVFFENKNIKFYFEIIYTKENKYKYINLKIENKIIEYMKFLLNSESDNYYNISKVKQYSEIIEETLGNFKISFNNAINLINLTNQQI